MDNRKLLMFGFIACILAALAYTFVFADLPFATPEMPSTVPAADPPLLRLRLSDLPRHPVASLAAPRLRY